MRSALRVVVVLLVLVVLLLVAAVVAEVVLRQEVETRAGEAIEARLEQATDPGEGFAAVDTSLRGSALLGVLTGSFDGVDVDARDGTVQGVPVRSVTVRADDVARDGSSVAAVDATVRVEAAGALAAQLEPELAESVRGSTVALPPDRLQVQAPFQVPVIGEVPVEVELLLQVTEGRLLVEPVLARAVGLEVDLTGTDTFRSFVVDQTELPAGLGLEAVEVVEVDGTALVEAELSCTTSCSLGG